MYRRAFSLPEVIIIIMIIFVTFMVSKEAYNKIYIPIKDGVHIKTNNNIKTREINSSRSSSSPKIEDIEEVIFGFIGTDSTLKTMFFIFLFSFVAYHMVFRFPSNEDSTSDPVVLDKGVVSLNKPEYKEGLSVSSEKKIPLPKKDKENTIKGKRKINV